MIIVELLDMLQDLLGMKAAIAAASAATCNSHLSCSSEPTSTASPIEAEGYNH